MRAVRPLAMVTGAARRVGRAVAVELARRGFDLAISCHRRAEDAEETLKLAARAADDPSFKGTVHRGDFRDPEEVDRLCDELSKLPRLDVLVHNASVFDRSPLSQLTADAVLAAFRINALAPLLLTTRLRHLLEASSLPGGGAVVAFIDIHIMGRPRRDYVAYSMSKAALAELVRSLAIELAPRVRVNGVAPGVIAWAEDMSEAEIKEYRSKIPLQRDGTPEDAARMVAWLTTDATYTTGEIIRLDGGRWLR